MARSGRTAMRKGWVRGAAMLGLAAIPVLWLGGCASVADGGRVAAGILEAAPEPAPQAAAVPSVAVAPPPPAMGPFLEGPVGARLAAADRDNAFKAETEALATGERKTWRGGKGTFGFVVPATGETGAAPEGDAAGGCRSFTHTIYFGGRPQTGRGTGCRTPDGTWRITG